MVVASEYLHGSKEAPYNMQCNMPLSHNHLIRIGHLAQFGVGRPCSEENFTNLGGGIHV